MEIGTGIALAGIWIFAGATFASRWTTSSASWAAMIVALGLTVTVRMWG